MRKLQWYSRSTKQKAAIIMLPLLLVVAVIGFLKWNANGAAQPQASSAVNESDTTQPEISSTQKVAGVRLMAVGDMLPHDTVNLHAKEGDTYNYVKLMNDIKPVFANADVIACNQESPSAGSSLGISGYPSFNAPTEFARDLRAVGCNVINLANNHLYDKGQPGIDKTLDYWSTLPDVLAVSGANRNATEQRTIKYFEKGEITFASLGFTNLSNKAAPAASLNQFDRALVTSLIQEADSKADIVLVSAHWGSETTPDVLQAQKTWAKTMSDSGADIIIGSGPHVLQGAEQIQSSAGKQTLVWYSLGNLLSSQLKLNELTGGVAIMDFEKEGEGVTLKKFGLLPTYMHYEWSKTDEAAGNLLARNNLRLYLLDQASVAMEKSNFTTSVESQTEYVKRTMATYMPVPIYTSQDYKR